MNISYLIGPRAYPNIQNLPEESYTEYDYDDFLYKILPELGTYQTPQERLDNFLKKFTFTKTGSKTKPLQAECWITKKINTETAYLHLVIGADGYYSTIFPDNPTSAEKYVYINLAEWEDNSSNGKRLDPLVQLRIDPQTGKGEWMWIRKSPSFSGTQALEFAKAFSLHFMTEAVMWDTAKVYEGEREVSLATWGLLARQEPEFLYSRSGFEMETITIAGRNDRTFVQHKELHTSAVHYLRNLKIGTIATQLTKKADKGRLLRLAREYTCNKESTLTTLCQKVDKAARNQIKGVTRDKLFLYDIASGEQKMNKTGAKTMMAISLVNPAPILKASYPFTATPLPCDPDTLKLFEEVYAECNATTATALIDWLQTHRTSVIIPNTAFSSLRISRRRSPIQLHPAGFKLQIGAQNQTALIGAINQRITPQHFNEKNLMVK